MLDLQFTITGDIELQARLRGIAPAFLEAAAEAIARVDLDCARFIVFGELHGVVLNWQTGQLADSIRPIPVVTVLSEGIVTGGVEQDDERAPYGKFQERGAHIPTRFGHPVMRWIGEDGNPIFRTRAKGFVLPARSFMARAAESFMPEYRSAVEQAMTETLNREIGDVLESRA